MQVILLIDVHALAQSQRCFSLLENSSPRRRCWPRALLGRILKVSGTEYRGLLITKIL